MIKVVVYLNQRYHLFLLTAYELLWLDLIKTYQSAE